MLTKVEMFCTLLLIVLLVRHYVIVFIRLPEDVKDKFSIVLIPIFTIKTRVKNLKTKGYFCTRKSKGKNNYPK